MRWRTRPFRAIAGILAAPPLLLPLLLAGCQTPIPPPQSFPLHEEAVLAMMRLPVIHVWMEQGDRLVPRGSAVVLGERRLALSLHQLDGGGARLALPGNLHATWSIVACGEATVAEMHANLRPSREDWAIIELDEPLPKSYPQALVDWERPVLPGEAVYVIGFPYGDALITQDGLPALSGPFAGSVIGGRVESPQRHRDLPRDVLYVRWGDVESEYKGVSGGAAAVWDAELGQPVIIGIMSGSAHLERGGTTAAWGLVARPTLAD